MNPFENPALAEGYEDWYETPGHRADCLEKALLQRLLAGFPTVHTLLEVGCGTGHFTRWFQERGLRVVGPVVMIGTFSNACPMPGKMEESIIHKTFGHGENGFDEPDAPRL